MKKLSLPVILLILVFTLQACKQSGSNTGPRTVLFDAGWKFLKDNPAGAENPGFDDSSWRSVDLPHDWSIEDLPGQKEDSVVGPFSKASVCKMGTGYTVGGTAWYRKSFTIDKADAGKTAYLQFDGVYMNSDVWVNGKHVGNHPYGYTSFWYDITPFLNPSGEPNIVAVQVKNEGLNARWYSGSGIYRHTWLTLVKTVHISPWGTYITTPEISDKSANIKIVTNVTNSGKSDAAVRLVVTIADPQGGTAGKATVKAKVAAGKNSDLETNLTIENPALWSVLSPKLYTASVEVLADNSTSDMATTSFGIRTLHFDAKDGFTLNGKTIDLKGGCFHHDNGPLGSAAIDRAEERKIQLLKDAGYNAIRCSHNPPSPYLLDVCDRLGMLVIDEAFDMWEQSKMASTASFLGSKDKYQAEDYSKYFKEWWEKDIESMLLRDRNHPSVILWSIGNEIPEAADSSGLRIAGNLAAEVRRLDPSRALTEANVDMGSVLNGKSTWEIRAPHLKLLDVVGYNYGFMRYESDHIKYPERIMVGTETMPPLAFENWQLVKKLPYVIGDFTWTAMDYLGEAGTGIPRLVDIPKAGTSTNQMQVMMSFFNFYSWPMFINFQGDIDLVGNPKPAYYYRHVVWNELKAAMFVHRPLPNGKMEITSPWGFPDELKSWNWSGHEGEKMQVIVYTRSKLVKLELNGKPVGEQAVDENSSITATFEVPYEPGTLIAHCFDNGIETASDSIRTTGKPAFIKLTPDRSLIRADRNDLSYVKVEVTDTEGNLVPDADNILIKFQVSGNGKIAGVGSGNPVDMASFQQPFRKTWQGRCLAILQPEGSAGKIILTARAEGLKEATAEIVTQ